MRKKYELTVILKDSDSEKKEGMALLEELFTKHGVKVQTKDEIGSRVLAYEIDDNQKGYYVFYIIDADNMTIDKLSADMRLSTSFLRFLIIRKEELTSAQKQRKEFKANKIREHLARKAASASLESSQDKDSQAESSNS